MKKRPLVVNYTRLCVTCGTPLRVGDRAAVRLDGLQCLRCAERRQYAPGPTEFKRAQLNPIPSITDREVREHLEDLARAHAES